MAYSESQLEQFALSTTVDITTTGRTSGLARRIEIWWFRVEGRFIITGTPGRRDWLANLRKNPQLIIHVNGLDIDAVASEMDDPEVRRDVFTQQQTSWYTTQDQLDRLVAEAPMIELHF